MWFHISSLCCHKYSSVMTSHGYDVIYSAYDDTHIVGVMSYKSGCDISGDIVMTKIQLVRCLIQGV